MMIWAKKKSPHFREKYLVLSYLKLLLKETFLLVVIFIFWQWLADQLWFTRRMGKVLAWHAQTLTLLSIQWQHRSVCNQVQHRPVLILSSQRTLHSIWAVSVVWWHSSTMRMVRSSSTPAIWKASKDAPTWKFTFTTTQWWLAIRRRVTVRRLADILIRMASKRDSVRKPTSNAASHHLQRNGRTAKRAIWQESLAPSRRRCGSTYPER